MSLHLVQILPDPASLARFAQRMRLPDQDPGYVLHRALRDTFGARAPQPFRLLDTPGQRLRLLGYLDGDQAELTAVRATDPDLDATFPAMGIAVRPMPDRYAPGTILGFEVRICPIVRTCSGERPREVDAFLHRVLAVPSDRKLDREAIYREWLAGQLERGGAELLDARMTGFSLEQLTRRSHASPKGDTSTADGPPRRLLSREKARGAARRPDAVFSGRLAVRDSEAFAAMLAKGLGRHRAFGFGMLLLRRA